MHEENKLCIVFAIISIVCFRLMERMGELTKIDMERVHVIARNTLSRTNNPVSEVL